MPPSGIRSSITIASLEGGRNGYDFPLEIPDDQCREAVNIDFWQSAMGTKRNGATAIGLTFSSGGPFTTSIGSLHRFVPDVNESLAQLWAFTGTNVPSIARLSGGTTWVSVANDAGFGVVDETNVSSATLNGAFYVCGNGVTTNRTYVWDASLSILRKSGLGTPAAAPTSAQDGAGGLSWTRYYRVRWVDISGSDTRRRSEASAVNTITISGRLGATVTRPALGSFEHETHWELEASDTANGPWYRIAQTASATTTFDDTNATIPTTNLSPLDGINRPIPAAQFVLATDARLIYAGGFSNPLSLATDKIKLRNNGIYITPVIGDNDIGDAERCPVGLTYTVDAPITGLGGPLDGCFYIFSYRRLWKFVPTGNSADPYARYALSSSVGCINHRSIVSGEDENGNPCIYFLSARGPYRIGANGLQYLGADISDLWASVVQYGNFHSVYYADHHQVWFYVSTDPTKRDREQTNTKLKFDTRNGRPDENGQVRKGWSYDTGPSCVVNSSVMFSNTIGATMSGDLKPYVSIQPDDFTPGVWKTDDPTVVQDVGTNYAALLQTKEYAPAGLLSDIEIFEPQVVASTPRISHTETVGVSVYGDFALDGGFANTLLQKDATFVLPSNATADAPSHQKIEGLVMAGLGTVAFALGDVSGASSNMFEFHALSVPFAVRNVR